MSADARLTDLLLQWELLREQGQVPAPEALCHDCPELLAPLREAIRALVGLDPLLGTVAASPGGEISALSARFTLRYRPLSLHARGGLGEVFVAEDTEFDRRVALKEIQGRFADHPASRARFLREGRVTAHLEHPGIVPVYGLGTYPDGRPFYAMRFIKGESLQEAITRYHQGSDRSELALRSLLSRFVAVCNAIAYAHSRGVIHRDLKPANVMLGDFGETLVVDWGLARLLGAGGAGEEALYLQGDASQTRAGEIAGTPAFMPPEQARGEIDRLDARSDVFALGAMLYALLTGKPPYAGKDALAQAQRGEPPAPRQVHRGLPAALDAVCRKAMAAAPERRYGSARELAAEVERWLADESVIAYREPVVVRLRRWGRRHRSMVTGGVVLLAASALGLAVGLWAVNREKERTHANLVRALEAEAAARTNFEQSQAHLRKAEANLKLARDAVDDCFNIAWKAPAFQGLQMEQARKLLFEKTLPFYQKFNQERPEDPEIQADTALQHYRIAFIEYLFGRMESARQAYGKARDGLAPLAARGPAEVSHLRLLAQVHFGLGNVLLMQNQQAEGLAEHARAIELRKRVVASPHATADDRHELALSHNNLGIAHRRVGNHHEALAQHRQARDTLRQLAKERPDDATVQQDLAGAHIGLGNAQRELSQRDEALKEYEQTRELYRALVRRDEARGQHPHLDYLQGQASAQVNCGALLAEMGRRDEARTQLEAARAAQVRLVAAHPYLPAYQYELATTHYNLGRLLQLQGKNSDAIESVTGAVTALSPLAKRFPGVPSYAQLLASAHTSLGHLHLAGQQYREALDQHVLARDALLLVVKADAKSPTARENLARAHNDLGWLLASFGQRDRALKQYDAGHRLQAALVKETFGRTEHHLVLARLKVNRGYLLALMNQPKEGLADLDEGVRLVEGLITPMTLASLAEVLSQSLVQRAEALTLLGRERDAIKDLDRALPLVPVAQQPALRLRRAFSLARAGDHLTAATVGDELAGPGAPALVLFHVGRLRAICFAEALREPARPLPLRERQAEQHARQAVALLRRAAEAGVFQAPGAVAGLDADARLRPLHDRDDYRQFRARLER